MKKKGFTLVELLGVIVVLAILALIVVPTIIGVIDKSRKSSLQNSGYGLVEAGTLYYAHYQNSKTVRFDIKENEITSKEENKFSYKGSIKEGTVLINNKGQVVICINDGKYAAYKNFKDNKVIVVDNKTCTIPENSNIVYLDNEATIDMNIEELVAEINTLKEKVNKLESEKSNQIDVTNSINNLAITHTTDMSNMNIRLDNLISNTIYKSMIHSINEGKSLVTKTDNINTGVSITIPANSYYCVTAHIVWVHSAPKYVALSESPSSLSPTTGNSSNNTDPILTTTKCGDTTRDVTYYLWASSVSEASNNVRISGFYIEK